MHDYGYSGRLDTTFKVSICWVTSANNLLFISLMPVSHIHMGQFWHWANRLVHPNSFRWIEHGLLVADCQSFGAGMGVDITYQPRSATNHCQPLQKWTTFVITLFPLGLKQTVCKQSFSFDKYLLTLMVNDFLKDGCPYRPLRLQVLCSTWLRKSSIRARGATGPRPTFGRWDAPS